MNISHRPRAAFTLIELLVVISLIAILAGLLLPSLGTVRESAKQSRCGNQMRQLGLGITTYRGEWEAGLPSVFHIRGSTSGLLDTYLELTLAKVTSTASDYFKCPTAYGKVKAFFPGAMNGARIEGNRNLC